MAGLVIETGADLREKTIEWLRSHFGERSAPYYFNLARGICHRQVRADRPYKSIGAERTFDVDLIDEEELINELDRISHFAWNRVERAEVQGRTVTLKVKYQDFQIITRSRSLAEPIAHRPQFLAVGVELLRALLPLRKGVRLLGLTLSGFPGEKEEVEAPVDEREPVLPLPL